MWRRFWTECRCVVLRPTDVGWHWRPAPTDGGRDFGNANAFATPPDVETLVRETIQNSIDARSDAGRVTVRYSVIELSKGTEAFEHFRTAVELDDLLEHVRSAASSKGKVGIRLQAGLRRFEESPTLTLLRIDDFGTSGLVGPEAPIGPSGRSSGPFAALMRDNLNSSKATSNAGGSFGLGKAVNWVCSSVATVVAASKLARDGTAEADRSGYRVIGKSELTWHQRADGVSYAGPGWFAAGADAGSFWVESDQLRALQLDRSVLPAGVGVEDATGTSLLIVGFHDPQSSDGTRAEVIHRQLANAGAKNFWPAILAGRLRLLVDHWRDGREMATEDVDPRAYVPEFCAAYDAHHEDRLESELSVPGDVASGGVDLRVVPTRKGVVDLEPFDEELVATARLLVRLGGDASNDASDLGKALVDHVALVRGRLMVVKYHPRRSIMVGGRPFHAVLLAGEAAEGHGSRAAEQFLRASEPPAHDDWRYGPDLADQYVAGSKARLTDFFRDLTDGLRELIRPNAGEHRAGREELRRLLSGRGSSGAESGDPVSLRKPAARVVDGRWHVNGEIHLRAGKDGRRLRPRLAIEVESGQAIPLAWESLEVDAAYGVVDDHFTVTATTGVRQIPFRGVSKAEADGLDAARCRVRLDVHVEARSSG